MRSRERLLRLRTQDKAYRAEMQALVDAVRNGKPSLIPFNEIVEVDRGGLDRVAANHKDVQDLKHEEQSCGEQV